MKLWIGARLDSDIDDNVFRIIRNEIETLINQYIQNIDYGDDISSWDIVLNVFLEGGKDLFKFNKKTKETEIELWITHSEFKYGNVSKQYELIYTALLKSIDIMQQKSVIKDFNFDLFKKDILKFKNNVA